MVLGLIIDSGYYVGDGWKGIQQEDSIDYNHFMIGVIKSMISEMVRCGLGPFAYEMDEKSLSHRLLLSYLNTLLRRNRKSASESCF